MSSKGCGLLSCLGSASSQRSSRWSESCFKGSDRARPGDLSRRRDSFSRRLQGNASPLFTSWEVALASLGSGCTNAFLTARTSGISPSDRGSSLAWLPNRSFIWILLCVELLLLGFVTFVALPDERICDFADCLMRVGGWWDTLGKLLSSFGGRSVAVLGSAYWEMRSFMMTSCSELFVRSTGFRKDLCDELKLSAPPSCCLTACATMATGGVSDLARSLCFSSCAFNSAALVLIFVMDRSGVGPFVVGRLWKSCGGN